MSDAAVFKVIDTCIEQVYTNLISLNILNAHEYVRAWNKMLKLRYMQHGLTKKDLFLKQALIMQTYRYIHVYSEFEVYFHFNIDYFIKSSKNKITRSVALDLIQSFGAGAPYMYDPVKDQITSTIFNPDPVLAVPFLLSKDTVYLIIDGNHRIGYAKLKAHNDILVKDFTPPETMNGIIGEFEKALYRFSIEANQSLLYKNCELKLPLF
jgi:hypothetical protein